MTDPILREWWENLTDAWKQMIRGNVMLFEYQEKFRIDGQYFHYTIEDIKNHHYTLDEQLSLDQVLSKVNDLTCFYYYDSSNARDFAPLPYMQNLEMLYLYDNYTELYELKNCRKLRGIHFQFSRPLNNKSRCFESIDLLKNLRELKVAYYDEQVITLDPFDKENTYYMPISLDFLKSLNNLKKLYLIGLEVKNCAFLEHIDALQELSLLFGVYNISSVKRLTTLEKLQINEVKGCEGHFIRELCNLNELHLRKGEYYLSDFSQLRKLKHLELECVRDPHLLSSEGLSDLKHLSITEGRYPASELSKLNKLEELYIDGIENKSLAFINHLTQLSFLSINSGNYTISILDQLNLLKTFEINGGEFESLNFLNDLSQLEALSVTNGEYLFPQKLKMPSLNRLSIWDSDVESLGFLSDIPALESVLVDEWTKEMLPHNLSEDVCIEDINNPMFY